MYNVTHNAAKGVTPTVTIHDRRGRAVTLAPGKLALVDLAPKFATKLSARSTRLTIEGGGDESDTRLFTEEMTASTLADMAEAKSIGWEDFKAKAKQFLGDNLPAKKSDIIAALRAA